MGRPRLFEEDEVLLAAREQFLDGGYHGTSVEDLSRVTGLSKGSLYGAFGDKDRLFQRVFDDYCTASDASAAALVEGPDELALDRLRAWLSNPARGTNTRGCLLAKGTAELAAVNDAVAARSRSAHEALLDACRRVVEQAQRAGLVDPEASAAALGGLIVATHRGLEALARGGVDVETRTGIADAAIAGIALPSASR